VDLVSTGGSISGAFADGGNTTTAAAVLGTNSNQPLQLETNDAVALTISQNGNVGVGTASPRALLHVGPGNDTPTTNVAGITVQNTGATALTVRDATNDSEGFLFVDWSGVIMGSATNHNLHLRSGNVNRLTIDQNGNVGVGTASPSNLFEVRSDAASDVGLVKLSNRAAANWGVGSNIQFHGESDLKMAEVSSNWSGNNLGSEFNLRTRRSGTMYNAIRIEPYGPAFVPRVSIGDYNLGADASGRFLINSFTGTGDSVITGLTLGHYDSDSGAAAGVGNRLNFQTESSVHGVNPETAYIDAVLDDATDASKDGSLRFGTIGPNATSGSDVATEKMRIDSAGNVGIGTSNPGYALDVVSNVVNDAMRITNSNSSGYGTINFTDHLGVQKAYVGRANSSAGQYPGKFVVASDGEDILFDSSTTATLPRMIIKSGGNVGIGTTTPAYALDVSGSIRITGTPYRDGGDIAWTVPSDARLITVTGSFERGLSELLKIDTVKYHYKVNNLRNISSVPEYTGVIAQNVAENIPEAVKEDDSGFLSLNTTPIF
jgi:hypothetical protein